MNTFNTLRLDKLARLNDIEAKAKAEHDAVMEAERMKLVNYFHTHTERFIEANKIYEASRPFLEKADIELRLSKSKPGYYAAWHSDIAKYGHQMHGFSAFECDGTSFTTIGTDGNVYAQTTYGQIDKCNLDKWSYRSLASLLGAFETWEKQLYDFVDGL